MFVAHPSSYPQIVFNLKKQSHVEAAVEDQPGGTGRGSTTLTRERIIGTLAGTSSPQKRYEANLEGNSGVKASAGIFLFSVNRPG